MIVSGVVSGDGGGGVPGVLLSSPRDDAGNLIVLGTGRQHWAGQSPNGSELVPLSPSARRRVPPRQLPHLTTKRTTRPLTGRRKARLKATASVRTPRVTHPKGPDAMKIV